MKVLGIETSCDETSAAVVERTAAGDLKLLDQVVLSQIDRHEPFGGVVPEIACRSHVESLTRVVESCLDRAGLTGDALTAIAVANRPGLIGALLVGVTTAKALAWAWRKPLLGIDHLEAHLEAPLLTTRRLEPPFVGVILSGGHTDLYHITERDERIHLGGTQDDAIGEAFDKVASVLGLPYPGGPSIEREARDGDPDRVALPRSLLGRDSLDFSFSGIKTAVLYRWRGQDGRSTAPLPDAPARADMAASFQAAVTDVLVTKVRRALDRTGLRQVVFGGGVTANAYLRGRIERELLEGKGKHPPKADSVVFPDRVFSTDNGAMIAALAIKRLDAGESDGLDLDARPSSGPRMI